MIEHKLVTAPVGATNWDGQKWGKKGKLKYPQFICRGVGCKKAVRTYCLCNVGVWMCKDCFPEHIIDVNS